LRHPPKFSLSENFGGAEGILPTFASGSVGIPLYFLILLRENLPNELPCGKPQGILKLNLRDQIKHLKQH
jgi:hypothetical protein